MLDDFLRQYIGRGQVFQIIEAVIFQPKNIQTRFVAGDQVFLLVKLEALCFFAFVLTTVILKITFLESYTNN